MDEPNQEMALGGVDAEIKELLGLFDVPAFARRGQDLEYALARLRVRTGRRRADMLDMVRLRLRQWAAGATGPDTELAYFREPITSLWPLVGLDPPAWGTRPASRWGLRRVARDLVSSVERFNRRWADFFDRVDLEPINRQIDDYNRYYLLEKECSLGSARLASRHFEPRARLSMDGLRAEFPPLPTPEPR